MEQFNNSKYVKNYKSFCDSGKTFDWNPNKAFSIGQAVKVSAYHEKYPDMIGHVATPKKLNKDTDYSNLLFIKLDNGKSDFIKVTEINKL